VRDVAQLSRFRLREAVQLTDSTALPVQDERIWWTTIIRALSSGVEGTGALKRAFLKELDKAVLAEKTYTYVHHLITVK